jgi:ABC-2 type transport system ATP-binding protein
MNATLTAPRGQEQRMTAELAIRTEHLGRDFGAISAVQDLTLEIPTGTVFGFLGPNGAGKSTTIRLLVGLIAPSRGRAFVLGFDCRSQAAEIRARTGSLLEHAGLYERLSAENNLDFYGRAFHMPATDRQARIRELLIHVGLYERRKEIVYTWSRGMKQRLAMVRALLHRPALIFLDEPTSGLDPAATHAMHRDLRSLTAQQGATVFLTTHNLAEAESLCDQVGIFSRGRLLAVGSPDELRARAGRPRLEVQGHGFDAALLDAVRARPEVAGVAARNGSLTIDLREQAAAAPLVRLIVQAGADVEEVRRGSASFEEAFLALTSDPEAAALQDGGLGVSP